MENLGSWPQTGPIPPLPATLGRIGTGIQRRWAVVATVALAVSALVLAASSATQGDVEYASSSWVTVNRSAAREALTTRGNTVALDRSMANWLEFASSDRIRSAVAEEVGQPLGLSGPQLAENVDVIEFEGRSATPELAAEISNAWAETFATEATAEVAASLDEAISATAARRDELFTERDAVLTPFNELREQLDATTDLATRSQLIREIDQQADLLSAELDVIDGELRELAGSLAQFELARLLADQGAVAVSRSAVPPPADETALSASAIFGIGSLGLIVGFAAAAALARRDQRLWTVADLNNTGLPVLDGGDDESVALLVEAVAEKRSAERIALIALGDLGVAERVADALDADAGFDVFCLDAADAASLTTAYDADLAFLVTHQGAQQRDAVRAARLLGLAGMPLSGAALVIDR